MVRMESSPPDNRADYGIADRDVADAIVAITQEILARYDDEAVLAVQQARLVRTVRDAVRRELRHRLPDRSATVKPRALLQALTGYVTAEVRKRQGWAFERQLAHNYGPLDPLDIRDIAGHLIEIDGIVVASTTPLAQSDRTKSA